MPRGKEAEAPGGFEPPNRGFADLSLSHLGTAPFALFIMKHPCFRFPFPHFVDGCIAVRASVVEFVPVDFARRAFVVRKVQTEWPPK